MALTGRAALVALAGVAAVLLLGGWGFAVTYAALALAIAIDLAFAGRIRDVAVTRSGVARVREGETAQLRLLLVNNGRRRVHGRLRDAWPPSAGATPRDTGVDLA